tara:strand:+ start:13273 stop:13647 length:375 start_codon:yes stop_codon:yes gene_type:complete
MDWEAIGITLIAIVCCQLGEIKFRTISNQMIEILDDSVLLVSPILLSNFTTCLTGVWKETLPRRVQPHCFYQAAIRCVVIANGVLQHIATWKNFHQGCPRFTKGCFTKYSGSTGFLKSEQVISS